VTWMRHLPIQRKLTWIILLVTSLVLLLAFGALAIYQIVEFRNYMVRDMRALADMLAQSTHAALEFQDEAVAGQVLETLQSDLDISAARIFAKDGKPFATYVRKGEQPELPASAPPEGHRFTGRRLATVRPVFQGGKPVGFIYLQADLTGLYNRLAMLGLIGLLVFIGSVLLAFVLSSFLQRPISEPILALSEAARRITAGKDYGLRVPAQGRDETGALTDAFNQMLAVIGERDSALRAGNQALSQEIAGHRDAENRVQAQLARLEMLQRLTRAIGERQDLQSIFQVVIRTLEERLPVDFCCVCRYEAAADILVVTSVGVRSQELAMDLAMTRQARLEVAANGLSTCVMGQLVYEPDISQSALPFFQRIAESGLRSLVAAPMVIESRVFGVLFSARHKAQSFTSGECEFLRQLSEHVALATHQAQLHIALQQAYDDLRQTQQAIMQQERLRALGQMASGIAHDINNAISPVALYTESLLETEPGLSPRARDYLTTIQHAVEDVAQTVSRMREFYRQREQQLTLVPVDLNRVIKQVIDLSRARWSDMPQQRGIFIKMETDLTPDVPAISGVESEIREALVNLVFNAVDALPEGGTLTLRSRVETGTPARVNIEVGDTGVGMDEDTRRRCLEPFFTTKGERGTGLGLAMVYGITRRHGADIDISSAPGRGTTMRLSFPVPAAPATAPGAAPYVFTVPKRLRILTVDDDPLMIKSLHDTLEADGHIVSSASGGREGIEAFRKAAEKGGSFALVITDLGMPYVDGRQVAAAVKKISPQTPVVMLTGWGQRLVAEGDIPAHVDFVLSKPPKLRELRETFVKCLELGNSGGQSNPDAQP